ncbi:NAD(P)H-dependent oxidoreductase subunit E [Orenia marismortui]|uniref:Thioredoxin-like protein n=1 Tax=Orenia marismortui TaxID=46469 RepID=A0A4R8H0I0_9FIRM|nr:NAD(P)H-dependent oxidoreductase subunit E [Orenia marismortui]TDX51323.1 thioredoxin-like protein [Orenia marismortui]
MSIKVKVCIGTPCHLMGAQNLIDAVNKFNKKSNADIEIEAVSCLDECKGAPAVQVDGEIYAPTTPKELIDLIKIKL